MSKAPDRSTIAGAAYLDLRRLAAETSRPTDELHQLYALEGFLDRLIRSNHRNTFALKGGVLLAAYTERRPTRDVDLAASQLQADAASILATVTEILDIAVDDGLTFDLLNTEVETIRDNADYPGMRAKVTGSLATAIIRFHIDINIDTQTLTESIRRVAKHRSTTINALRDTLDGYADIAQPKWAAWRRKQQLQSAPEEFSELLTEVVNFTDPILRSLEPR